MFVVDIFWRNANGAARVTRHTLPNGGDAWVASDYLAHLRVGPQVLLTWDRVEVTREETGDRWLFRR